MNPVNSTSKSSIVVENTGRKSLGKQSSVSAQSENCIKIKVNNRMIDLKDLVKLCNSHCSHCGTFKQGVRDKSQTESRFRK